MNKALLLYHTTDGKTLSIISKIASRLAEAQEIECELHDLSALPANLNLSDYSAILIGASIRYGHFNKDFLSFTSQHFPLLNEKKSAFFSVNLTARKEGKDTPETNGYTRKFLEASLWKPNLKAVFAGALCYPKYRFIDKMMLKFIMRLSGDKQDTSKEYHYTNWDKVDEFSEQFIALIKQDSDQ